MKNSEIMAMLAAKWKELSADEKKPYTDKAKAASEKNAEVMKAYKESETHKKYLEDKKAYIKTMEAKRKKLMKQAGLDDGAPKAKRAKKSSGKKSKKAE